MQVTDGLKEARILERKLIREQEGLASALISNKSLKPAPANGNGNGKAEPPRYSNFYKKKIEYASLAAEYMTSVGKKAGNKIIKAIQQLADNGHRYPALVSGRIEGGEYDGLNKIRARRYRILWKEESDCIFIARIYQKKDKGLDNIKV